MECFRRSCSDCLYLHQMDLGSYQTLRQMKFMVPGSNRYKNVAVGLIFTSEMGSNPSCSLGVFTLHV